MVTGLMLVPVYDSVPVQKHQSGRDLGCVETGARLVELPRALDLEHQVASVHVLHDEEQAVLDGGEESLTLSTELFNKAGKCGII